MKRDRIRTTENAGCSIQQSATLLGLDTFTVHSLIQRRKLSADVMLWGELAIRRDELQRVLGGRATFPRISGEEI
ncbi:MAG: hypothetical protein O2960_11230 [Verrucomicrobia bacterium]|nr:hypothetical protein [Verrucomicrobiota bacterium]